MLTFATEFPLARPLTAPEILALGRDWLLGSPHSGLSRDNFGGQDDPESWSIDQGREAVEFRVIREEEQSTTGFRYVKRDDGLEWTTTMVSRTEPGSAWMGVRVHRDATGPAPRLPHAKKPYLLRQILATVGAGPDGPLPVLQRPHRLCNTDIALAKSLILGESGCYLPVVYLSSPFVGDHVLDADWLARGLAGMAHVVVEPNRAFSRRLQFEVESQNVYGGSLGLYWPDSTGRRYSYFLRPGTDPGSLGREIRRDVQNALTHRRPLSSCTWTGLQELIAKRRVESLKRKGSTAVEEYVQAFDEEMAAKNTRIAEAEREIQRLKAEIRMLESTSASKEGLVLDNGCEQDLFPGERLGIVVSALAVARTQVVADSRRQHVLDSLLGTNADSGEAEKLRGSLKETLRGYRRMDKKVRDDLTDLGFEIEDDTKHYKLLFRGDDRYTFTLPKSGSDHRGGLNAARDIGKRIF